MLQQRCLCLLLLLLHTPGLACCLLRSPQPLLQALHLLQDVAQIPPVPLQSHLPKRRQNPPRSLLARHLPNLHRQRRAQLVQLTTLTLLSPAVESGTLRDCIVVQSER